MRWLALFAFVVACGDDVAPMDADATTPLLGAVVLRFEVPEGATVAFELDSLRVRGDTAEHLETGIGLVTAGESSVRIEGLTPGLYSEVELAGRALVGRGADGVEVRLETFEWMARCSDPFELGVGGDVEVVLPIDPEELEESELGLECGEPDSDETAREARHR